MEMTLLMLQGDSFFSGMDLLAGRGRIRRQALLVKQIISGFVSRSVNDFFLHSKDNHTKRVLPAGFNIDALHG